MEEEKKESKLWMIGGIVAICFFIWFFIYGHFRYRTVPASKHYTIAKIYEISPSEGGWFIGYTFVINGIKYKNSDSMPTKGAGQWTYSPKEGERYYVKFLPEDPDFSTLCLDKTVPDSIKEPPPEGWVGDLLPCTDNYE